MSESPAPERNHRNTGLWGCGFLFLPVLALLAFRRIDAVLILGIWVAPPLSLIGGVVLGIRLGRSSMVRFGLALLLTLGLLIGSEGLLFLGCSLGHWELKS